MDVDAVENTPRENNNCREPTMVMHSLHLGDGGEGKTENKHELADTSSNIAIARRSGFTGTGTHHPRRSLKSLLLSCQRKNNIFENSKENTDIVQGLENNIGNKQAVIPEICEAMSLKRSSSVPHRVSYPLHDAVNNADMKELAKLFKKKKRVDIDLKDQEGFTPLHRAAQLGLTEAVELFVSHGANVNVRNKDNLSPLYYAVQSGNFECASFLIEHGADDGDIQDGFSDSKLQDYKGNSKFSRSRMASMHN